MTEAEEERTRPTPGFATQQVVFEQVEGGHFLVWDRIEEKFIVNSNDVWRSYTIEGTHYIPLQRLPWPSVTTIEFYQNEEQLFNNVKQFFTDHLDVQNELFYDIYTAFVLASWRVEDFKVVPYLFFLGPLSSGKTRALECLQRLCYRGILATSLSAASLFRALEAWHPTLFLDESEIYNRKEMIEVLALLNSGYRKGQYAIRIEKIEEGNPQIAMFDTFGFKSIAGTEELASTLQSRCIITHMSRAIREVRLFIDEEQAQSLRNQLLYYRFKNLGKNVNYSAVEFAEENGCFRNARVIELFISLIQVAPTEEVKQRLIKCMRQITQSRLEEERTSVEARIFEAIIKCKDLVENGKVSTRAVADAFNEGLPENEQVSSRFIGRKMATLGFEKCRLTGGTNGFYWDEILVNRLKLRYTATPEITSLTSQTSLTSLNMEKTEVKELKASDVSDVSSPQLISRRSREFMEKSDVSEESEVSDVNSRIGAKHQLIVKRVRNAEKCFYCEQFASEYELDDHGNKYYVCLTCLKGVIVPAYKRQEYEIIFSSEA